MGAGQGAGGGPREQGGVQGSGSCLSFPAAQPAALATRGQRGPVLPVPRGRAPPFHGPPGLQGPRCARCQPGSCRPHSAPCCWERLCDTSQGGHGGPAVGHHRARGRFGATATPCYANPNSR